MKRRLNMTVNGHAVALEVAPHRTLLEVLREDLGLTGVREGCSTGDCGACTVLLNGKAVVSCLTLAPDAEGASVTTIEGLAKDGKLDAMQEAFIAKGAIQCGFCTPGMILAAKSADVLEGNLCRCTGYAKIQEAIRHAGSRGGSPHA
ncbi:MAG: (2Fe-2S)-binding protein [Planctomycetes bacterium]|nr:(2Fe-2S)-binding protein [Planctomycetota bacterium]